MSRWKTIADIRREYGNLILSEKNIPSDPLEQFEQWFAEVLETEKSDPTAMVLSTVDESGLPDSRVVLLKGLEKECFIFYTNYQSAKARQIEHKSYGALNFYWPQMARQVRVRGHIQKVNSKDSDAYFATRPRLSQLSSMCSHQSQEIKDRGELDKQFNQLVADYEDRTIQRPDNWGGYALIPEEFEFWQGRDNRLHDRIQYVKINQDWVIKRLAP